MNNSKGGQTKQTIPVCLNWLWVIIFGILLITFGSVLFIRAIPDPMKVFVGLVFFVIGIAIFVLGNNKFKECEEKNDPNVKSRIRRE